MEPNFTGLPQPIREALQAAADYGRANFGGMSSVPLFGVGRSCLPSLPSFGSIDSSTRLNDAVKRLKEWLSKSTISCGGDLALERLENMRMLHEAQRKRCQQDDTHKEPESE